MTTRIPILLRVQMFGFARTGVNRSWRQHSIGCHARKQLDEGIEVHGWQRECRWSRVCRFASMLGTKYSGLNGERSGSIVERARTPHAERFATPLLLSPT
jgi:hypothetical protein